VHRDSTVKHGIDLPLKLHREIERCVVKSENFGKTIAQQELIPREKKYLNISHLMTNFFLGKYIDVLNYLRCNETRHPSQQNLCKIIYVLK